MFDIEWISRITALIRYGEIELVTKLISDELCHSLKLTLF